MRVVAAAALQVAPVVPPRPGLELSWDAPHACPSEAHVQAEVGALLPRAIDPESPVRARAVVEERAYAYQLSLEVLVDGHAFRRQVTADRCEDLARATALLVAVVADPLGSREHLLPPAPVVPRPVEDVPPVPESPPAEPTPADSQAPEVEPPAPTPLALDAPSTVSTRRQASVGPRGGTAGSLRAEAGVAMGVLPGVGALVGIVGAVQHRWFRAELGPAYRPRRSLPHPDMPAVAGAFQMVSGVARACGVPGVRTVSFPLCVTMEAGGIRAEGHGAVTTPEARWSAWAGAGAEAALRWRATDRVSVWLGGGVLASLARPAFSVGSVPGSLHRVGPVAGRIGVGLAINFGSRTGPRGRTH